MGISVLERRDEIGLRDGRLYIDGEWRETGDLWTHVHPASGEEVGSFHQASPDDVILATAAARRAFDDESWSGLKARDRKRALQRVAQLIGDNVEELNTIQALDNGVPIAFADVYQLSAEMAADIFDYHAGWVDRLSGDTLPQYTGADVFTMTLKEPVGVVGAVIPWNAPLMLFAHKVAPALAAGCTVVLKPSEYATFAAVRLAELIEEADLPPGVFNLVLGEGSTVGEALITSPDLDKITFTGSRAVGRRIIEASASGIVPTSLELGGKSASLIFPDVDLDMAAMTAMGMVSMALSGQGCVCHTRAVVHESIYDDFVDKAAVMAGMCVLGGPFDEATTSAPIINPEQLDRVLGLIARAQEEGARLVTGGERANGELAAGNFVTPTLFADVDNDMTIAREEVFGPVLAAIPFRDEAHAIEIANDSDYGLGAGVQTSDSARALRLAKALRAGTVGVNGFTVMPNAPFGGYKQSGLGREGGIEGIEAFLETKTVTIDLGKPGS